MQEKNELILREKQGGYLVYLSDGRVPFFRVYIVFDYLFWSGLSKKKVILQQPVVKTRQKGNFVRSGCF